MKCYCTVWLMLVSFNCFSQFSIEPYSLQIGINKTTNLIFPYEIKSVDRGSRDVLVQKAKGIENVLQVKANALLIQVPSLLPQNRTGIFP